MKKLLIVLVMMFCVGFAYAQNATLSKELTELRTDYEGLAESANPAIDDLVANALAELDIMDQATADMVAANNAAQASNAQLKKYLDESQRSLARMKIGLDQVSDRMQESNEWLAAAYDDLDAADAQIAMMKVAAEIKAKQLAKVPLNSVWHVANGTAIGSGIVLMATETGDPWIGRGLVIAGAASEAIWWIGHLLFEWW